VAQVGRRLYEFCLHVAAGQPTAAEALAHHEFKMLRYGPIY